MPKHMPIGHKKQGSGAHVCLTLADVGTEKNPTSANSGQMWGINVLKVE